VRVVVDANVLFSAFATDGACAEFFEHVSGRDTLLSSPSLLRDLRVKLVQKAGASAAEADAAVRLVRSISEVLDPPPLGHRVCRDADDDEVLSLAITAKADCLVTGDKDLLVLESFEEIPILRVREFWNWAGRRKA
jgi:uncharacterized protein